jgi:ABC-2 type transport system permease protein
MRGVFRNAALRVFPKEGIDRPMSLTTARPFVRPGVRRFGRVNWRGVWTLYVREVARFLKLWAQTVIAPVTTALLFLAIFALALGRARAEVAGLAFTTFLAPGLIMMQVVQNAFANTSSSLMIAKIQGSIVDMLMPPLSAAELTVAIALGGLTRGLLVAVSAGLVILPFVDLGIAHAWAVVYFAASGALLMSVVGIIGGIWADKFDHLGAITNFVIMPLAFLSGTFYSLRDLPGFALDIAQFNPFFHLIDGFRYGVTGHADGDPLLGAAVLFALNAALFAVTYRIFAVGWRLKA